MAKKKSTDIEPIVDEVMAVDEPIEEVEEIVVEEPVIEEAPANDPLESFIDVQLKVINRMSDRAKARRLADRVLSNRKGK